MYGIQHEANKKPVLLYSNIAFCLAILRETNDAFYLSMLEELLDHNRINYYSYVMIPLSSVIVSVHVIVSRSSLRYGYIRIIVIALVIKRDKT